MLLHTVFKALYQACRIKQLVTGRTTMTCHNVLTDNNHYNNDKNNNENNNDKNNKDDDDNDDENAFQLTEGLPTES